MQDFAAHSIGHIAPQTILYDGRYRIDLLLAEAPTRAVYRAWDLTQQRPATILELATRDAATAAAALQHAAPLVQLNHDALTPIQVIFVERGTLFLALALAGGQTIERIMAERANPITAAAAVRWIAQAAEGVEFLDQELPTWHLGDLSPAALLVTAEDRVQLLGFEVALGLLSPEALAATLPVGAVAPELLAGQCDARADVYGLAATLYYLLTRQRWSPQRESLANARADLSRALVATVMRGLAAQPEARWPDAATFYQELLRSLPVNHPSQRGAPWWDEDQPPLDGLAEEPPTLIMTRDQLRAAVAAQQAALGITPAEETPPADEVSATAAPSDTYIIASPETTGTDAPTATIAENPPIDELASSSQPTIAPESPPTEQRDVNTAQTDAPVEAAQHDDMPTQPDAPLVAAAQDSPNLSLAGPITIAALELSSTQSAAPPAAEHDDAAPTQPAAPADDIAQPEPVPATILRPRWPWSDLPDEGRTTVASMPGTADVTESPPAEADTPDAPATATPTTPREQAVTPAAGENGVAPPDALPEPAFADTLLRWPELLPPDPAASNGMTSAEADQAVAAATEPTTADSQTQAERDDSADLTALPTQIKALATPEQGTATTGAEQSPPPPYSPYSMWDAAPPAATHDLTGAENTTPVDAAADAAHLTLDADIVATAAHAPETSAPSSAAATTTTVAAESAATTTTPTASASEDEQVIVAHSDYLSSEPPPVDAPKTSKTPSRPLGSGLLDRLRTILHTPGQMPALATGTVVVPRHMYPQHTYSVLVRLQCRPSSAATPGEPPKKEATFIIVEVEAAGDAFYVPVRRLALRLPNEGGLSEGTFTITALRPSPPTETDPITFTFRSVDNQLLHEGQFLAEISILAPQQLAGGTPMLTLVHALDIEQALA